MSGGFDSDAIQGGGSMFGGGFDFGIGAAHDSRMRNRARRAFKRDRDVAFGREDTRLQRLVADALAAGIHPLFALGAGAPANVPMQMDSGATNFDASAFGRSLNRLAAQREAEVHEQTLAESRAREYKAYAEGDFALSHAIDSFNKRGEQAALVQQDQVKGVPDEMISSKSSDPSSGAGSDHPAFRTYVITQWGLKMDLPYTQEGPGEAMENIALWQWPFIIQHNRSKYGDDWGTRFFREFVNGDAPKFRRGTDSPSYRFQNSPFGGSGAFGFR